MNGLVVRLLVITAGWGVWFWLWRRVFRGAGFTILIAIGLAFTMASLFSHQSGLVLLALFAASSIFFELMRIVISPKYYSIQPSFETNQVLRGLSPIEASFFVGAAPNQIITVALATLADKAILRFSKSTPSAVEINQEYISPETLLSAEGRNSFRTAAARRNNLILSKYEHALIELILPDGKITLDAINLDIWYQFVQRSLDSLATTYDFNQTKEYARNVIEKMTADIPDYAENRSDPSGWFAACFFDSTLANKSHRPDWLKPGDDFESFMVEISKLVATLA
jgi:hypothetical protein